MFGLPAVIISIVCYSICCVEPFDEEGAISDEDVEEENKENKGKKKPLLISNTFIICLYVHLLSQRKMINRKLMILVYQTDD